MEGSTPSSISVSVRVRPLTQREARLVASEVPESTTALFGGNSLSAPVISLRSGLRRIVKVCDDRVLVFDPESPLSNAQKHLLGSTWKKSKDMRFCFDKVYDETATQDQVYQGSAKRLVDSALCGYNATVFAYGATGCGKTHTISGTPLEPGIIYLLMKDLFDRIEAQSEDKMAEISISYLEIYNETIRDLIVPGPTLTLREAPNNRVIIPGLSEHQPKTAEEVISLIHEASQNRSTNHTEANSTSSRSHAVLSVNIKQRARTANISEDYQLATLSVIDLAGSERASVTLNKGARLHEGANINRSLLALGNCINALCDPRSRGHVPYRDSKLTRLLKHSLGGNCCTSMVVCVSPSSQHYDETHNTLQYANRAKEIKTKVIRNVVSVDRHVSQYVKIIYELRQELEQRKRDDALCEEKARAEERAVRNKCFQEMREGLAGLEGSRRDAMERSGQAASAKAELEALERLRPALTAWLAATALDTSPDDHFPQRQEAYRHVSDMTTRLTQRGVVVFQQSVAADNAKTILSANMAMLRRKITHPEAIDVFEREQRLADLELELEESKAREQGQAEATRHLCSALAILANVQLLLAGEDETYQATVHRATGQFVHGITQVALPSVPLPTVQQRAMHRPTLAVLPALQFTASSPRKPARSAVKLKSSFMSPRKKAALKLGPVKKTVLFKEDVADGWEVESTTTDTDNETEPPRSTAAPLAPLNPVLVSRTDNTALPKPSKPVFAVEAPENTPPVASVGSGRPSSRMAAGFLGRNKASNGVTVHQDIKPPPRPSQLARPVGTPHVDGSSLTNSSFGDHHAGRPWSSAGVARRTSTARRRSSLGGPIRSERKKKRPTYLEASPNASRDDSFSQVSPATGIQRGRVAGRVSTSKPPVWR